MPTWTDATEEERWYAGGAFDGDGCVSVSSAHFLPRLELIQAQRGRALLDTFQALFGGAIYERAKPADPERHQPTWAWVLTGALAMAAARSLAPYAHLKRPQLLLVGHIRTDPKRIVHEQVACLKRHPHLAIEHLPLPTPYAAGLLDTDGSFRAYPHVSLQLTQKYPAALLAMQGTFGGSVCGEKWTVYGAKAKDVVRTIRPFLVVKNPQADILLRAKLTKDIDAKIALLPYQGNQGARRHRHGLSKLNCLTRSE